MVEKNDERQNKVKEAKNDKAGRSVGPPIKKRLGKMGLGEMRLSEMRLGEMLPNRCFRLFSAVGLQMFNVRLFRCYIKNAAQTMQFRDNKNK